MKACSHSTFPIFMHRQWNLRKHANLIAWGVQTFFFFAVKQTNKKWWCGVIVVVLHFELNQLFFHFFFFGSVHCRYLSVMTHYCYPLPRTLANSRFSHSHPLALSSLQTCPLGTYPQVQFFKVCTAQSVDIPRRPESAVHFCEGASVESGPHSITLDNLSAIVPKRYFAKSFFFEIIIEALF